MKTTLPTPSKSKTDMSYKKSQLEIVKLKDASSNGVGLAGIVIKLLFVAFASLSVQIEDHIHEPIA